MSTEQEKTGAVVNLSIVKDALEAAEEAPVSTMDGAGISEAAVSSQASAETQGGRGAVEEPDDSLPDACPVTALGHKGDDYFYLDASRQLRRFGFDKHAKNMVRSLFAGRSYLLESLWPRFSAGGRGKEPAVIGWDGEAAVENLIAACHGAGIWNPNERERGAGAWLGENGELILHCGDKIWRGPEPGGVRVSYYANGTWLEPGLVGRYVYPAREAGPKPIDKPQPDCEDGPAAWLLSFFGSWNWRRGEIDAILLLGWVGAAMIGGALDWRPLCWLTGKTGCGKSTLQEVIESIFNEALIKSKDTSGAGIWQKLGHDTLPVAIDELEATEDNRKAQKIIELARAATDGSLVLRGGADHVGHEFTVRSCFLFSSILIPPMLAQDRNRQAFLELKPIEGRPPLIMDHAKLRETGAQLRRRIADAWPRMGEALMYFRAELESQGHTLRGAKQFGTILALAHVMLFDGPIDHESDNGWAEQLKYEDLAAWADDTSDEQAFLEHISTTAVDPHRGGTRRMLGEWIGQAANPDTMVSDPADKVLRSYGLRVRTVEGERYLAIATNHKGLWDILGGTHWIGRSGARNPYVQTLRNIEGMIDSDGIYFGAKSSRAVLVPLDRIWQEEGKDDGE